MHIRARFSHGLVGSALLLASATLAGAPARKTTAAAQSGFELTVDSIMRGPKLVGYPQSGLRWSGDSSRLYFEWRRPQDDETSTWVVGREGGQPRQLNDADRRDAPPANGVWDAAHGRALFVVDGDIALVDSVSLTRRAITRTTSSESNPRWARHETAVTFTRDNNLFVVPLEGADSGVVVQLTDVAPKKNEPRETDSQKFVKAEEQKLIEHTRVEAEKKKKADEKAKALALPTFELADRQSASDLQLSPDGKHVFLLVTERSELFKRPNVPNYVTESSYTEDIPARAFVGDAQEKRMLAVVNLETGKSEWADAAFAGTMPGSDKPQPRGVLWQMPIINRDGTLIVSSVRGSDNKDRWLVAVDPESGKTRVIDALHDDAWVRELSGPGPADPSFGWMPDQRHVWFLAERDGWMHLYSVDAATPGAAPRQLTQGKWEIDSATLSQDGKKFYISSTETSAAERHLYSMSIDGGPRTKLTSMSGAVSASEMSPDDSTIGLVYSYSTKPHEVFVMANAAGATAKQVTTSPIDEWRAFKWIDPQLITYRARDGIDIPARLYTPDMIGARRDPAAPAVVFVHGSGYLQNAHKYWSSYFREYMFHNLLASRGYVVLDADYRASAGYGRDWRTAIYRRMGGKDLDDVLDGAKYLVEKQKVNPKRIGVYGGSYGGFITLMAMFTSPDTFAAGAALRPVTDWSHYNHGYTSNILNAPQSDADAYRKSSPIYFAEGLKGALLICHGMVDTNVLFQDSVRLAQRLIELRKENWEIAPYPVENHAFEEAASWADEYKRILKLFEDNLKGKGTRAQTD